MPGTPDLIAPIQDADIEWISALMGLRDLDEPRRTFLKSLETVDVSACPGSGKTTLVVAKLAILARNWTSPNQGVCVLSHTNVAHEEIQRKLTNAAVGRQLLGYPHYIDTIHGFVNRFLAIPWLLSHGHTITAVDNDITTAIRRRLLGNNYFKVKGFLDNKHAASFEKLRLGSTDLEDPSLHGYPSQPSAATYKLTATAFKAAAHQGYFCHDEMFLFAEALLKEHPEVAATLSRRFPFVLIDEMQDTSARQSRLLDALFNAQPNTVCVQRVGDPNQAIYDDGDDASEGVTFPDPARHHIPISDSFRFDHSIAQLASGLAVTPVEPDGLRGIRQLDDGEKPRQHTIFVFPDGDTSMVLPAYAAHVLATLPGELGRPEAVTAVGQVHMLKDDVPPGHKQYPGTVCHYWSAYRPAMAGKSSAPTTLVERIRKARSIVIRDHETGEAVNVAAAGIIYLANRVSNEPVVRSGMRPHRSLSRAIADDAQAQDAYRTLLTRFVLTDDSFSEETWAEALRYVESVVSSLTGAALPRQMNPYCRWQPPDDSSQSSRTLEAPPNVFRLEDGDTTLDVQLSSIHAVKGQTHLATLVLETYNYSHVLKALMAWLAGERSGAGSNLSPLNLKRLRLTYVAMTRPSHLLCLAVPESSLGKPYERDTMRAKLIAHGWRVEQLCPETG
jgi:hypothetical protein